MTKRIKILCLIVAIITLFSTLSFASQVQPREGEETAEEVVETNEELIAEVDEEEVAEEVEEETAEPEWINSDLYKAGDKIEITEIVDGNAFIAGQEVILKGEIGGNVFIAANKVTIESGYVYSSLHIVANEVVVNGIVYDAYIAANTITIGEDGYIYRDLRAVSNVLSIDGQVRRDVYFVGKTINLNEENGTLIGGNLKYTSNSETTIPEGAVQGEVTFSEKEVSKESVAETISSYIFNAINALVYTLVVILLCIWLAPKFVERVSTMNTKKALTSLGIGIVAPIAAVLAIVILLISSICSKVAIAAALVFAAICMSSTAFASIYFGSLFAKLLKWEGKVKLVISAGIVSIVIWLISIIPFIGGFVGFIVSLFGLGLLIMNIVCKKEKVSVVEEKTEE